MDLLREELKAEKQKRKRLENQIEELCASVNKPKLLVLQASFFLYHIERRDSLR